MTNPNPITDWFPKIDQISRGKRQILCFPFAGGGASFYYRWAQKLPADIELLPARLPGRESRFKQPAIESISEIADLISSALDDSELDETFAILGYSMGAVIGFEVARRLVQMDRFQLSHLIIVACSAPSCENRNPPVHELPDDQFVEAMRTQYGGISDAMLEQDAFLQAMLPTIRADMKMIETYSYEETAPLDVPILGLGGANDSVVPLADLDAWRNQTSAGFKLRTFPGGHFFFEDAEKSVTQMLVRWLKSTE